MTTSITPLQAMEYHNAVAKILDRADPAQLARLRDVLGLSMAGHEKPSKLINGAEAWTALQTATRSATSKQDKGPGYWRQLAPPIKAFLACAGQAGAPGCRTEPNQNDRKKHSGAKPKDMFTQEEVELILAMAKRHGRTPTAIQQDWVWNASADR